MAPGVIQNSLPCVRGADWLALVMHLCKRAAFRPITVELLMQAYSEAVHYVVKVLYMSTI